MKKDTDNWYLSNGRMFLANPIFFRSNSFKNIYSFAILKAQFLSCLKPSFLPFSFIPTGELQINYQVQGIFWHPFRQKNSLRGNSFHMIQISDNSKQAKISHEGVNLLSPDITVKKEDFFFFILYGF